MLGCRHWALPLVVVGMNSIAIYCMSQLLKPWIGSSLRTHFGREWLKSDYAPVFLSASVLLVLWLFCLWLYRRNSSCESEGVHALSLPFRAIAEAKR